MGATLVCLWLNQGSYFLAAVGDSRGYLLRGGRMIQISEDHTIVAGLLRRGMISPQEARVHPRRNVLSQAMGVGEVEPDFFQGELEPGDRFLLVSDGVSDLLSREELGYYLGREPDPERAGRSILEQVAGRHGSDDATVLVVCAQ
jgi:protein phosphatase